MLLDELKAAMSHLCSNAKTEHPRDPAGYIEGVLDMYNKAKRISERERADIYKAFANEGGIGYEATNSEKHQENSTS